MSILGNRKLYNFTYSFRIRYSEVDAQGIVFNAHYLTYFDCAITEYFRKINFNYAIEVKKNKEDFHVIKTTIEYKAPIIFDQIIDACIRVAYIGNSSLKFDICLFPNSKHKLLASGEVIQVYADQIKNKSIPLPKHLVEKIKKFEKI